MEYSSEKKYLYRDARSMISVKSSLIIRKVKIGCFCLISGVLSILSNLKSYCLRGSSKTLRRILLINLQHIGDFVWTTSVIRTLSKIYPGVEFDIVIRPESREIASFVPNVRKVLTYTPALNRTTEGIGRLDWSNLKNVLREITKHEYDGLIVLTPQTILNLLVQIFFLFKKRPIRVCDISWLVLLNKLTGTMGKEHWLDMLKQAITPLSKNGEIPELIPFIEILEANRSRCKPYSKDKLIIGFCIGAGWKYRKWNRVHYLNVANLILQEYKNALIMVYGYDSEDFEAANFIRNNCRYPERIEIFPRSEMIDFLRSLKQCNLVISNDSGPAHISSALAVPLIVILGPETPDRVAPRGISTVKVYWKKVECSPCAQTVCFNPVQRKCIDSVLPEEVFEGVREIIQGL